MKKPIRLSVGQLGPNYWTDRLIDALKVKPNENDYLRPAQHAARVGILESFKKDRPQKFLVDMATQSGKTPLYIRMLQLIAENGPLPRVLIIAPYRRLVNQLRDEFVKFGRAYPKGHPLRDIGVWHALEKQMKQVTGTTWASAINLVRDGRIKPENYDIVWVDEGHLSQTKLRKATLAKFKNAVVGFWTATPAYNEDKSLEKEAVLAFRLTPEQAVEQQVISQWRSVLLKRGTVDLSNVPVRAGEYEAEATEKKISEIEREQAIIEFYRDWIDPETGNPVFRRKGFVNTVSIERANYLAERLNRTLGHLVPAGVKIAEAIHSNHPNFPMSAEDQEKVFRRFSSGHTLLVVQIRLAGLGLSTPDADISINDAPSLSPVEVSQRGGRVVAINPNNSEKCALQVDFLDRGDGMKMPLLYGEVVGAGIGYTRTEKKKSIAHLGDTEDSKVISDPEAVADFIRRRIQSRVTAMAQANISSAYPNIVRRISALGLTSVDDLYAKTSTAYTKFFPENGVLDPDQFRQIVAGNLNPWDDREIYKSYRPVALALSGVLGMHARDLFGTPEELHVSFPAPRDNPTPQRQHIRALMRQARNPFTGGQGISETDLRSMASTPGLRSPSVKYRFDGATAEATKQNQARPFIKKSGAAKDWVDDLASIVNDTPEGVFQFDAEIIHAQPIEPDRILPLRLPLDRPDPLNTAAQLRVGSDDILGVDDPVEKIFVRSAFENALQRALSSIPIREERILRQRFGLGDLNDIRTLEDIGSEENISKDRVRQLEERAIRRLKHPSRSKALRDVLGWESEVHGRFDPGTGSNLYAYEIAERLNIEVAPIKQIFFRLVEAFDRQRPSRMLRYDPATGFYWRANMQRDHYGNGVAMKLHENEVERFAGFYGLKSTSLTKQIPQNEKKLWLSKEEVSQRLNVSERIVERIFNRMADASEREEPEYKEGKWVPGILIAQSYDPVLRTEWNLRLFNENEKGELFLHASELDRFSAKYGLGNRSVPGDEIATQPEPVVIPPVIQAEEVSIPDVLSGSRADPKIRRDSGEQRAPR